MEELIKKIPKVELHLHIEGSLEPELMFQLAKRNSISLPYKDVEEIRQAYNFKDLQSFLDLYYQGMSVLKQEQDFYDLTMQYLVRAHEQNMKHVEIFFDPQAHIERNINFDVVFNGIKNALDEGKNKYDISSEIILCFLRHLSEESAFSVLEQALPYKEHIIAVGLDSSEVGNPPEKFQRVFEKALQEGFLTVAHAGEEGPPEYIRQALDLLKVSRIDHGVRCLEDEELVKRLVTEHMPLTVCPLSNVKLRVFDNVADVPVKSMLDKGLCVTLNSDDPAYFDGYLMENYILVAKSNNLEKSDIIKLASNAIQASFLSASKKKELEEELLSI